MKRIVVISLMLLFITSLAYAGYVSGYTRKDGTYVQGYYRSEPNSTRSDNYGRPSSYDIQYNVPSSQRDYDRDGILNIYDKDDNNNGILDDNERN